MVDVSVWKRVRGNIWKQDCRNVWGRNRGLGISMKRWGRWPKLTLLGALLAELFLPSPSAIGARWREGLTLDLKPMQFGIVGFMRWDTESTPDPQSTALSLAMATQDAHTPDLFAIDGVVGTAVGIGADGTPVVLVYTAWPGVLGLPVALDGTPVRTEVTGEFWALGHGPRSHLPPPPPRVRRAAAEGDEPVNRRGRFPRPVPIGVSGGQPDVTAGTIGARVSDGERTFALSNNHVFANRNNANRGDAILQPGRIDGGTDPANSIGTLHDFERLRFCGILTCPENRIDAAIALTSSDNLGTSTPPDGYGEPQTATTTATLGQAVQKYGRTTGLTTGQVSGINATINVNYNTGTARFVDQILISDGRFSQGGDSGSLVVTRSSGRNDRRPVALLFAGSNTHTIANPIDLVLDRFKVKIDGN